MDHLRLTGALAVMVAVLLAPRAWAFQPLQAPSRMSPTTARLQLASLHVGQRGPWHLARVHGAVAPPPPPPPVVPQFFFPTGKDLILAAAALN